MTADRDWDGRTHSLIGEIAANERDADDPVSKLFARALEENVTPEEIIGASMNAGIRRDEPVYPFGRMYDILTMHNSGAYGHLSDQDYARMRAREVNSYRKQVTNQLGSGRNAGNNIVDAVLNNADLLHELFQETYGHLLEDSQK